MSKKLNFATINPSFVEALSIWNQSTIARAIENKRHTETVDALQKAHDDAVKKADAEALTGEARDAIVVPTIRAIEDESRLHKNTVKPLNDAINGFNKKYIRASVLYSGYSDFMSISGSNTKFTTAIKTFMLSLNVSNAENDTALNKACVDIAKRIGAKNAYSLKDGAYSREYSESAFSKNFTLAFMQLLIDRKLVEINADNSVTFIDYSKSENK